MDRPTDPSQPRPSLRPPIGAGRPTDPVLSRPGADNRINFAPPCLDSEVGCACISRHASRVVGRSLCDLFRCGGCGLDGVFGGRLSRGRTTARATPRPWALHLVCRHERGQTGRDGVTIWGGRDGSFRNLPACGGHAGTVCGRIRSVRCTEDFRAHGLISVRAKPRPWALHLVLHWGAQTQLLEGGSGRSCDNPSPCGGHTGMIFSGVRPKRCAEGVGAQCFVPRELRLGRRQCIKCVASAATLGGGRIVK